MLIVVDVGNTNTVCGVFGGEEILRDFRFSTNIDRTADEYASLLLPLMDAAKLNPAEATGVIICSVVPPLNLTFEVLSKRYFHQEPLFVEPGVKTGLSIRYENPTEVGADRIVNGLAARELYGAPVIVADFGTATTFDVVNAEGEYAGGVIAPGLGISAEALFSHASRLYQIDLRRPKHLVGRNTAGAMQSGLYYGYVGLVDGILARLIKELGEGTRVVGTGGEADLIASGSEFIHEVNPQLTLLGLKMIYDRNR
ncbi:MAG: type III pantothenate kinase [Nitrospirae bacterium]|nr:type III pantothenate kinase [Nitrospirota bacterium]